MIGRLLWILTIYSIYQIEGLDDQRRSQNQFVDFDENDFCHRQDENRPLAIEASFCCDSNLQRLVEKRLNALPEEVPLGYLSRKVQRYLQRSYNTTFEVVIAPSEFVLSTYSNGGLLCKFQIDNRFYAVYKTPNNSYDYRNRRLEDKFATVDHRDPHGWKPVIKRGRGAQTKQIPTADDINPVDVGPSTCGYREKTRPGTAYGFKSNECCNRQLESLMKEAVHMGVNFNRLGDSAKHVQRYVQQTLGISFEVIVSKQNFAISTYYLGSMTCKIQVGDYFYAMYATPQQYNVADTDAEDWYASLDANDPLGITRTEPILTELDRFIRQEPETNEVDDTPFDPEEEKMSPLSANAGPIPKARQFNRTSSEEGNGQSVIWGPEDMRPPGTHCDKDKKGGNKCCSGAVYESMKEVIYELSASPQFNRQSSSIIANALQQAVQKRFQQSYEVIVANSDFEIATHSIAEEHCKYKHGAFTILAYETPKQYDIDSPNEAYFASISNREPLGGTGTTLPGQRPSHIPLAIEGEGERRGMPVGSHCDERRTGSKCCNTGLFDIMQRTYDIVRNHPRFDPFNTRSIARSMQWQAEETFGQSFEVVVARDDFVFASNYTGDDMCKYKVDKYVMMAYYTPVQYPPHTEMYADNGRADPVKCQSDTTNVNGGSSCCDGALRFEMSKALDQAENRVGYDRYRPGNKLNAELVAKVIENAVQRRYNTTYETVISKGDFSWSTNKFGEQSCKLALNGYHVLSFQSSLNSPIIEADPILQVQAPIELTQSFAAQVANQAPFQPIQQVFQPQVFQPPVFQPQGAAFVPPPPVPPVAPPVAAFAGAGGGGGGACFSTDTWLTTPDGKKRMDDIKVGDFVLTANATAVFFTPVTLWMHREPDTKYQFVTLMTEYGKMLALTSRHLIFRNKCDEFYEEYIETLPPNSDAVYAEELEVGDCMILLYKGKFRQQRLMRITNTTRTGIFAPLTPNGRIIVNDILASCYSEFNEATLQTTYFSFANTIRRKLMRWIGMMVDNTVELPYGTEFTTELLKIVIPFIK